MYFSQLHFASLIPTSYTLAPADDRLLSMCLPPATPTDPQLMVCLLTTIVRVLSYPLLPILLPPTRVAVCCPASLRVASEYQQKQNSYNVASTGCIIALKKKNNIFSCCIAVQHGLKTLTKSIAFIGETG